MTNNNRGEIVTATVIAIAVATFLIGACWRPVTTFFGLGSAPQKTTQKNTVIRESKPYYVTGDDGKSHLIEATKTTTTDIDTNETPKLTLWQKLLDAGKIWILLMVLGIFFPPIAWIMNTINTKAKAVAAAAYDKLSQKHDELTAETTTIVQSVDIALKTFDAAIAAALSAASAATDPKIKDTQNAIALALTETQKTFLIALSRKQDGATKALVSSLKNA